MPTFVPFYSKGRKPVSDPPQMNITVHTPHTLYNRNDCIVIVQGHARSNEEISGVLALPLTENPDHMSPCPPCADCCSSLLLTTAN